MKYIKYYILTLTILASGLALTADAAIRIPEYSKYSAIITQTTSPNSSGALVTGGTPLIYIQKKGVMSGETLQLNASPLLIINTNSDIVPYYNANMVVGQTLEVYTKDGEPYMIKVLNSPVTTTSYGCTCSNTNKPIPQPYSIYPVDQVTGIYNDSNREVHIQPGEIYTQPVTTISLSSSTTSNSCICPNQNYPLSDVSSTPVPVSANMNSSYSNSSVIMNSSATLPKEKIIMLQNKLKEKGYFPKNVNSTGYYGTITTKAIKDFQYNNDIRSTGVIESETMKALGM